MVANIPNAEKGFSLIFSAAPLVEGRVTNCRCARS
jgi:hypothetical protein